MNEMKNTIEVNETENAAVENAGKKRRIDVKGFVVKHRKKIVAAGAIALGGLAAYALRQHFSTNVDCAGIVEDGFDAIKEFGPDVVEAVEEQ